VFMYCRHCCGLCLALALYPVALLTSLTVRPTDNKGVALRNGYFAAGQHSNADEDKNEKTEILYCRVRQFQVLHLS